MPAPVIFDRVWKKFRQGERHDSLRDLIPATIRAIAGRSKPTELQKQEFWAVEDVTFEVQPGEALGIIGPNGAGKSTTLKLLTRILRPNRGRCSVKGRVGALIEVAAGFHPDLTGRENVYLQGALMGMKRAEVAARFDQIIEFAGVGPFVDTQIKRYSSGMNARLGFSIAAHLSPDVLIIDEVLSVGDMAFQEKCVQRMRQLKRDGVTIVFVSHNLQAVSALCDRAVYLNRSARAIGPCAEVINKYVNDSFTSSGEAREGEIHVLSATLYDADGRVVRTPVAPAALLTLRVDFEAVRPVDGVTFTFCVHRATDQLMVYDETFAQRNLGLASVPSGRFSIDFRFEANLTRGQYYFDVFSAHVASRRYLGRLRPAAHLTVAEDRTFAGVAHLAVRAAATSDAQPEVPTAAAI
jgi:lipopolysaccharide transport system ATP-binding protein